MQTTGKILKIGQTKQRTDTFKTRAVRIEHASNPLYPQVNKFELSQDKCELLDNYQVGDTVTVSWNLRGRVWINPEGKESDFTTLDVWRIEKVEPEAEKGEAEPVNALPDDADDLPF